MFVDNLLLTRLPRVTAATSSCAIHDFEDLFSLTEVALPHLNAGHDKVVYRLLLCCSGDPQSNCERQCGGIGVCWPGCTATTVQRRKGHNCAARVSITATLQHISDGVRLVTFTGTHVAAGDEPRPPPLLALRPDASTMRALVQTCRRGRDIPSTALQTLEVDLKEARDQCVTAQPDLHNGRYNVNKRKLEKAVGRAARDERGGDVGVTLGDWGRSNMLIREYLLPHPTHGPQNTHTTGADTYYLCGGRLKEPLLSEANGFKRLLPFCALQSARYGFGCSNVSVNVCLCSPRKKS